MPSANCSAAARSDCLEEQAAAVHSEHRSGGGLPHEVQVRRENIYLSNDLFPFSYINHKRVKTKQPRHSLHSISSQAQHYLWHIPCSLFIQKISILIQNMMKICKACNKPFSHLISQFHTSEEIVETILHFITNINIYKHSDISNV